MSYLLLAFFMGLLGSLHCVGMCGPLVLASTGQGVGSRWRMVGNQLLYQVGRTLIYGVLGLAAGLAGHALVLRGWQQGITLVTGTLLVATGALTLAGTRVPGLARLQHRVAVPLTRWIVHALRFPGGYAVVGMLNGLLPCGMVYMALAGAVSADTVAGAGRFMLLFGLGTWPVLLAVSWMGGVLRSRLRVNVHRWLPIFAIVLGGWFLLRGAGLDIPYLSPLIYPEGTVTCGHANR